MKQNITGKNRAVNDIQRKYNEMDEVNVKRIRGKVQKDVKNA